MQAQVSIWIWMVGGIVVFLFLTGIKIVRPTRRGLVERLGKYHHFANPGFHWLIPVADNQRQP
jgi:regulator of protease activity HflC (stomatin/prohibitin superfamily)